MPASGRGTAGAVVSEGSTVIRASSPGPGPGPAGSEGRPLQLPMGVEGRESRRRCRRVGRRVDSGVKQMTKMGAICLGGFPVLVMHLGGILGN